MELEIDARKDAVEQVLKAALSDEDFAVLKIDTVDVSDAPLSSQPRRLDPLTWVGLAMLGGVIGNGTYEAVKKASAVLIAHFGRERVVEKEKDNKST